MNSVRNRIKTHRKVRAGDLVANEWNFRGHPEHQKPALGAIYREVGFARSLLAFELPDGRLKLIDGHLRRDLNPDMLVDVEILDVSEEEVRKLLLSIDPPGRSRRGPGRNLGPPPRHDARGGRGAESILGKRGPEALGAGAARKDQGEGRAVLDSGDMPR